MEVGGGGGVGLGAGSVIAFDDFDDCKIKIEPLSYVNHSQNEAKIQLWKLGSRFHLRNIGNQYWDRRCFLTTIRQIQTEKT